MTYEQEFLKDFEAWVVTQVKVNETALAASKKIWKKMAMSVHVMQVTVMKPNWMLTIS